MFTTKPKLERRLRPTSEKQCRKQSKQSSWKLHLLKLKLNRRQRQQDGFEERLGRKMTNQKMDSSRGKTSGTRELEKEKKSSRKKKYVPTKNVAVIKPSQKRSHEKKCTRLQKKLGMQEEMLDILIRPGLLLRVSRMLKTMEKTEHAVVP
ncbi:hypothetical protein DPMN_078394 [Dreissena polymorpha]|uniref:Uncharacterized protein n=1 Tax=Dreissena polymorpha TaxID=45954 RepID=A0A9D3YR40_DREPO|nr:hypothetical protein DPMN_078394 [Dreissena polymorpha]